MKLETDTVVIELDQPLGDRQLLGCRDAPCDRIGDSLTGHPGRLALDRGLLTTTGMDEPIALDLKTGQPAQDDDAVRPPLP